MFLFSASKIARQRVTIIASIAVIAISVAALAGWVLDLHLSRDLLPSSPEMKPNAAVAFLLSGIGLLFATTGHGTRPKYAVSSICGLLVFLFGSITLGEYIFGFDARIDGLLLSLKPHGSAIAAGPRITTYVCVNFALIGLALATQTGSRSFRKISTYLSLLSLVVSYAAVLGYLFGAEYVYGIASSNGTAPYAAALFTIFTIGVLAANFDSPIAKLLTSASLGGSMARKLLPAVVLIPTFVGWLRILGQNRGLYDTGFGSALMIFVCVALMCGIVLFVCSTVHKADKRRKLVEEELVEKERRYRELFDYGQSLICIHDVNGSLTTVNPAALASLGYDREEIVGKNIRDFMPDGHKGQFPAFLRQINNEGISDGTFSLVTKSGKQVIWQYYSILVSEPGQEPYILGNAQDITKLIEARDQLKSLSLTDDLTGLSNRRGFQALAEQQIKLEGHSRTARGLTLMFADLDGLKAINDKYGHQAGSDAIVAFADVLRSALRSADLICRWGGDEFVILTIGSPDETSEMIVNRIYAKLDEHNAGSNTPYRLACSIGVTPVPKNSGRSFESLIDEADRAMYNEKRRRKLILAA